MQHDPSQMDIPPQNETGAQPSPQPAIRTQRFLKRVAVSVSILFVVLLAAFTIPYYILSKRIDQQLAAGPWRNTFSYYTSPESLFPGDPATLAEFAAVLKRAGYSFTSSAGTIIVDSRPPVRIQFASGHIFSFTDLTSGRALARFELAPQLVTSADESQRVKITFVHYSELPPVLIQAIVSAEDKRFFEHSGFDRLRILKAIYVDLREERKEQGASTISMQLARNLWLRHNKSWKRKATEMLATAHLERTLSKQQILEDYCNTVYLGSRGTFGFHGFAKQRRPISTKTSAS